ncbi:MAG: T9SS type A sorting domain-containing protein [Bacteroidia bacterium]
MKKFIIIISFCVIGSIGINAQIISTIAGNGSQGYTGDGGQATAAELYGPTGVAIDASGNIYIADYENDRIRKVNTSGIISTFAGTGTAGSSGDGGNATAAELYEPMEVAIDIAGNVYIADYGNNRIRKVNTSGIISTIAGNGTAGSTGNGGNATAAELNSPMGVAVDVYGNIYIADYNNNIIRIVNSSGIIKTIAGTGTGGLSGNYNGDGIAATAANLDEPGAVSLDASGNIYISDFLNNRIREINTSGIINTVAGNGTANYSGDGGPATAAEINLWAAFNYRGGGVVVDASNNIYIGDYDNSRLRKVNSSGIISTIAGTGTASYSGDGGPATAAELHYPTNVAVDASGNVYFADYGNNRIRKISNCIPPNITVSSSHTIICPGNPTMLMASGATSYTWSPATGLNSTDGASVTTIPGTTTTYTVTGTTSCGSGVATITIKVADSIKISVSEADATCGKSNGKGIATVSGGTSPYKYSWNNGDTTLTADNLAAGIYMITVTDKNGCSAFKNVTVNDTNGPSLTSSIIQNKCSGQSKGSISLTASGGTPPYKYSWSNGATTASIGNLPDGLYQVIVTDADSCSSLIKSISIKSPAAITLTTSVTEPGCSSTNGDISVSALGGTAPYTYKWNTSSTSSSLTNIGAGIYSAVVTDNNGCKDTIQTSVSDTSGPVISITSVTGNNCSSGNNGSIDISVTDGSLPYSYLWSNGATTQNISGLSSGLYNLTVTDGNGCKGTANTQISGVSPSGVSICMVSVDTASEHNVIVWNKAGLTGVDSFKVYYLNYLSEWQLIKAVPFSAPPYLVDSTPVNDPNQNTVRYCLTAVNSCGVEEPIASSPWQNTMHIMQPMPGSFLWTGIGYLKQGVTQPVKTYYLFRDSLSNGNWKAIDSVNGFQNTFNDIDYQNNPGKYPFARWFVGAILSDSINNGCTVPELRPDKVNNTTTRSNTQHNIALIQGIQQLTNVAYNISVYPNPSNGVFQLRIKNSELGMKNTVEVYNMLGEKIYSSNYQIIKLSNHQIDISNQPAGIYLYRVVTEKGEYLGSGKLIIQK